MRTGQVEANESGEDSARGLGFSSEDLEREGAVGGEDGEAEYEVDGEVDEPGGDKAGVGDGSEA